MAQLEMEIGAETNMASGSRDTQLARQQAQAGHETHRQGTVACCILCEDVAYEPGWYALLASFARGAMEPSITLPDAPILRI